MPLLFLHLGVTPAGGFGGQAARSPRRSLDLVRLVSGGRRSALSRVAVVSAVAVVFGVMQLGAWMTTGGGVPLLRLLRVKLTSLGSGEHGEDHRPACHKVSVSSLATTRFIGSENILVCEGALPDLGLAVARLFFRRCHGGGGGRWWTKFRRGTRSFKSRILILLLAEFFVQFCLTSVFMSCDVHMCNLCKMIF